MDEGTKKVLDNILFALGIIALVMLVYGIIRTFIQFKMEKEILSWVGNAINFLILVYLIRTSIILGNFNFSQSLIVSFGLLISILIQLSNVRRT